MTMVKVALSNHFKKDLKKVSKRGYDLELLNDVVEKLANLEPLPPKTGIIISRVNSAVFANAISSRTGSLFIAVSSLFLITDRACEIGGPEGIRGILYPQLIGGIIFGKRYLFTREECFIGGDGNILHRLFFIFTEI